MRKKTTNAWCAGFVAGWNAQAEIKKAPIIRCTLCRHYSTGDGGVEFCKQLSRNVKAEGYCAWGELK